MKPLATPLFFASIFIAASLAIAADPTPPTTQTDPAADRLTFLTLQLSSIEASLNAVNLALRAAGYKVVLASEKADQAAQGNELMDRKGGAPIAWDKFYGKTAKEFAPRDVFGVPHNYDRPSQFDYLYRANNDQIAKANGEVGALGKKIDVLLARRRQLDTEQSALWATIAWESIQNHDIPLNPLYRFQLKATAATPASDARRDVLRPAILFLRTIDKTVADDLDSLSANQEAALKDLKDRTEAAYAAAKEPFANAMLSADVSADDLKTSKDLLANMKHLAELSKNITEAYHLALDGDAAGDDNRKLTFRAQLQFALLDYSTAATDLDYQLSKLANTWGLEGEKGIANPDKLPSSTFKIAPASNDSIPVSNNIAPPSADRQQPVKQTQWLDLFNGHDLQGWKTAGNASADWKVVDDAIVGTNPTNPGGFLYSERNDFRNFRFRFQTMLSEGTNSRLDIRSPAPGNGEGKKNDRPLIQLSGTSDDPAKTTGSVYFGTSLHALASPVQLAPKQWFDMEITANENKITVAINGTIVVDYVEKDNPVHPGCFIFTCRGNTTVHFRKIQIMNLGDTDDPIGVPSAIVATNRSIIASPPQTVPIVQFSSQSLTEIFGNDQLRQCHVDPDGTMTSDKEVHLTLLGTENKDFTVSGEIFFNTDPYDAATAKSNLTRFGSVLFQIRYLDGLHGYGISMGLGAKRVLVEGKILPRMSNLPPFDVPTHQWLPFRYEVRTSGILANLAGKSAILKGPLNTIGTNALWLAPGGKVRGLRLEVEASK